MRITEIKGDKYCCQFLLFWFLFY